MKAEIKREYQASNVREISVDHNGYNYLIIYGKHINGWFIAIPNWKVCIEATEPTNWWYNKDKLAREFQNANTGLILAHAIKEHYEGVLDENN